MSATKNGIKPAEAKAKKLFEVTVTAYKTFYVEADSEEEALDHSAVEEEQDPGWHGDFDWHHDSTLARELGKEEADIVRQIHPANIAKEI